MSAFVQMSELRGMAGYAGLGAVMPERERAWTRELSASLQGRTTTGLSDLSGSKSQRLWAFAQSQNQAIAKAIQSGDQTAAIKAAAVTPWQTSVTPAQVAAIQADPKSSGAAAALQRIENVQKAGFEKFLAPSKPGSAPPTPTQPPAPSCPTGQIPNPDKAAAGPPCIPDPSVMQKATEDAVAVLKKRVSAGEIQVFAAPTDGTKCPPYMSVQALPDGSSVCVNDLRGRSDALISQAKSTYGSMPGVAVTVLASGQSCPAGATASPLPDGRQICFAGAKVTVVPADAAQVVCPAGATPTTTASGDLLCLAPMAPTAAPPSAPLAPGSTDFGAPTAPTPSGPAPPSATDAGAPASAPVSAPISAPPSSGGGGGGGGGGGPPDSGGGGAPAEEGEGLPPGPPAPPPPPPSMLPSWAVPVAVTLGVIGLIGGIYWYSQRDQKDQDQEKEVPAT